MESIFLGLLCGFINAARGQDGTKMFGISGRWISAFMLALAICLANQTYGFEALYLVACIMILLAPGWGKYFMAGHGWPIRNQREFWIADVVADAINPKSNYVYGIIGMTVRIAVCAAPLAVYVKGADGLLYVIPAGLAAALSYAFWGWLERKKIIDGFVRCADFTTAFAIAVIL